jgi:hypothetical protein
MSSHFKDNMITIDKCEERPLAYFHYLLIDLWYRETRSIRGMGLMKNLSPLIGRIEEEIVVCV